MTLSKQFKPKGIKFCREVVVSRLYEIDPSRDPSPAIVEETAKALKQGDCIVVNSSRLK